MSTSAPLSWVKQVQEGANLCQKIPLWGSCPLFPLEKISEEMQKKLDLSDFKLLFSDRQLLKPEEFLTPFGTNPKLLSFQLSPLPGYLTWILSAESMGEITSLALSKEETQGLSDPRLQEGFYQFLLLQMSEIVEGLKTYPDLHIQWLDKKELPKDPCLGIDLSIKIKESSFLGRLVASSEFHTAFLEHFSKTPLAYTEAPSYPKVDIPLSLEVGSCLLDQSDFASLHVGDFLILDRCSYDPSADKGTAVLSLAEQPCFIVKIKKTGLKILDYAVYHGDLDTMDEEFIADSFEEETPLPNLEEVQKQVEEETPLPKLEETEKEVDDEATEEEKEEIPKTTPPEVLTSPLKIPFPIVIEVDRIKMSLEKLLQLAPGNILEMTVRPSQGVYLTVHGKKIAKGELIKIGEVLGVKILEIGDLPTK
ncbi:MAG: type III secretion system cytoplasmic ring protein SctQ [Chlamydiota bacterium]